MLVEVSTLALREHTTREKDVDKTIVGLVGAISTVAAVGVAQTAQAGPVAAPGLAEVMRVESYEDLLKSPSSTKRPSRVVTRNSLSNG
jgi:hypothetical protein